MWELAVSQHCDLLLTTDGDFVAYSMLRGAPPKVVYLARQDNRTAAVATRVRASISSIRQLAASDEATYLIIP